MGERYSDEVRAYIRDEWGGDASVLRAWTRTRSPRERGRFRGFLRRTVGSPEASRAPAIVAQPASTPVVRATPVEDCEHVDTEYLGASGFTEFVRCVLCGTLLILQPGAAWTLRRATP